MAITRDAFVYMDPKPPVRSFAQCETCTMWTGRNCVILGDMFPVFARDSCNVYVHGISRLTSEEREPIITPSEVGFVRREVRCENCIAYEPKTSICKMYKTLNDKVPEFFELDINVHPYGCCNAQTAKDS